MVGSGMDALGQSIADGRLDFEAAHSMLFCAHERLFGLPADRTGVEALKDRITLQLVSHMVGPRSGDEALLQRMARGVVDRQVDFTTAAEVVVENVMHHVHEVGGVDGAGDYWDKDQRCWTSEAVEYRASVWAAVEARMDVLVNRAIDRMKEEQDRGLGR